MLQSAIYFEYYLSPRLGGPPGYLFNLKAAIESSQRADVAVNFSTLGRDDNVLPDSTKSISAPWWRPLKSIQMLRRQRRSATRRAIDHGRWLESLPNSGGYDSDLLRSTLALKADVIHAHTTIEAAKLIRATRELPNRPLIALTSHCPEAPSREWSEKLRSEGASKEAVSFYRRAYENVDAFAFENVDFLIFPCEEAKEPYLKTMPGFDRLVDLKPTFYVPTGSPPTAVESSAESVRSQYGIPKEAFVIGYIGRHNEIKGYDILARAGLETLKKNPNAWVVCAGQEGPLKTPRHPRWLEIGWTKKPGDLINAFDVFVLPNRETYFDLIAIEVLSVGTPLIASNRGGNKYFGNISDGVFLFENGAELLGLLERISRGGSEKLGYLRDRNVDAYSRNFSLKEFSDNYQNVILEAHRFFKVRT